MDRDVALALLGKINSINTALTNISENITPETSSASSLSMAPLMSGTRDPEAAAPVEDSEVPMEETEEPEEIPETTTKKKSTSK